MGEEGAIGGSIDRDDSVGLNVLSEVFWFGGKNREGIRLFKAFRRWGHVNGATQLSMIALMNEDKDKIDRFYTRAGLAAVEVRYLGRII